ncbi:polyphenol oxidase family protein, partial [Candidatus Dependentiae bacterium]|nr:polyphenol oxidase family protein [Candidatus Dependentiae bacterium]
QGIAPIVVRQMCMRFGSDIDQLRTWVGPHARSCCYEVKEEFRSNLLESIIDLVLFERDGKLFFDTFKYNEQLLLAVGIKVEQIDSSYSLCTMCNIQFHSRRNDGALYIGQSSIAWLV